MPTPKAANHLDMTFPQGKGLFLAMGDEFLDIQCRNGSIKDLETFFLGVGVVEVGNSLIIVNCLVKETKSSATFPPIHRLTSPQNAEPNSMGGIAIDGMPLLILCIELLAMFAPRQQSPSLNQSFLGRQHDLLLLTFGQRNPLLFEVSTQEGNEKVLVGSLGNPGAILGGDGEVGLQACMEVFRQAQIEVPRADNETGWCHGMCAPIVCAHYPLTTPLNQPLCHEGYSYPDTNLNANPPPSFA
jgi:hypothetical protein